MKVRQKSQTRQTGGAKAIKDIRQANQVMADTGRKYWGDKGTGEVGFFHRDVEFSAELADVALFCFSNFFKASKEWVMASSLYVDSELEKRMRELADPTEEELKIISFIKCGWISSIDYSIFGNDYDHPAHERNIDAQTHINNRYFDPYFIDQSDCLELMRIIMSTDYEIPGFLNLIDPIEKLRLYPHENTGFDVWASLNSSGNSIGRNFLNSIDDPRFKIVVHPD